MSKHEIGSIVTFGHHEWRILDIQKDKMLLITDCIIDHRPYHNEYVDITWAECSLRQYLNTDFLETFSFDEQCRIQIVINKNEDNPWYHTNGGVETEDKVFLLSLDEVVCKYFGDSSRLLYDPLKNQRYWYSRKDTNNPKRIAKVKHKEGVWWWWIRTPGRLNKKAIYIHGDGNVGIQGNNILKGNISDGWCTGGIRPALWVTINTFHKTV